MPLGHLGDGLEARRLPAAAIRRHQGKPGSPGQGNSYHRMGTAAMMAAQMEVPRAGLATTPSTPTALHPLAAPLGQRGIKLSMLTPHPIAVHAPISTSPSSPQTPHQRLSSRTLAVRLCSPHARGLRQLPPFQGAGSRDYSRRRGTRRAALRSECWRTQWATKAHPRQRHPRIRCGYGQWHLMEQHLEVYHRVWRRHCAHSRPGTSASSKAHCGTIPQDLLARLEKLWESRKPYRNGHVGRHCYHGQEPQCVRFHARR